MLRKQGQTLLQSFFYDWRWIQNTNRTDHILNQSIKQALMFSYFQFLSAMERVCYRIRIRVWDTWRHRPYRMARWPVRRSKEPTSKKSVTRSTDYWYFVKTFWIGYEHLVIKYSVRKSCVVAVVVLIILVLLGYI